MAASGNNFETCLSCFQSFLQHPACISLSAKVKQVEYSAVGASVGFFPPPPLPQTSYLEQGLRVPCVDSHSPALVSGGSSGHIPPD